MFHLYGLIVGVAIVAGWTIAERIEPKVSRVAPWIILYGIVGARIYHVVDFFDYYQTNPWQIIAIWNGGLGIWGGISGSFIAFELLRFLGKIQKEEYWKILSAIAVAMPLSQAIGRVANGANGEFVEKVWMLPWWSVEAICSLVLFGYLQGVSLKISAKQIVGRYLVGYGVIRLGLEMLRENAWELWSMPVASIFAVFSVIIGAWLMRRAQD